MILFVILLLSEEIVLETNAFGLKKFFYDFKRFTPLLCNLASKDFKIKYRRSMLGVAWSILNPLLTMLVLTKVFSMLMRITVPNFATYYIVGAALWSFFAESTSMSMQSIMGASSLIKKVYIPKYMFPLEKCLFSLINFGFSMIAVLLVMMIQGVYPTWISLLAIIPVVYCFVFCCGMSLFLSAATVFFRDIAHLYGVLLTLWMYLTPVIYPMELVKEHATLYMIVRLNPMYHFVIYFRDVMMYNTIPGLRANLLCIGISLVTLAIGSFVFKKTEGRFILHI